MATTQKLITAKELAQLPDDGQRYELIEGVLITMAPSGSEHAEISLDVGGPLRQYVKDHDLGRAYGAEGGFLVSRNPDTVLAPDAAFVSKERLERINKVGSYLPIAPDLAVEIISPNDLYTEVQEKVESWLRYGARMVVVLNPRHRTVAVHRSPTEVRHLTINDTLDGEDVVPGWRIPVRELFTAVR
jgi:Uma2 family endonuclease